MNLKQSRIFIGLFFLLFLLSGYYAFLTDNRLDNNYLQSLNKVTLNNSQSNYEISTDLNNLAGVEKYPKVNFFPTKKLQKLKIFLEFFQDGYAQSGLYSRDLFLSHKRIAEIISFNKKINHTDLKYHLNWYFDEINKLIKKENSEKDYKKRVENLNLIYKYVDKHKTDLETTYYFDDDLENDNNLKILFYDVFETLKKEISKKVPIFNSDQRIIFFEEIKQNRDFGWYEIEFNDNFQKFDYQIKSKNIDEKFDNKKLKFELDNETYLSISQSPFLQINWQDFKKENNQFVFYLPANLTKDLDYLISYRNFFPSNNTIELIEFSRIDNEVCFNSQDFSFLTSDIANFYNYYENCLNLIHSRSLSSLLNYDQTQFKFKAKKNNYYLLRVRGDNLNFYNLPELKISFDLNTTLKVKKTCDFKGSFFNNFKKQEIKKTNHQISYQVEKLPHNLFVSLKQNLPLGFKLNYFENNDSVKIVITNQFLIFSQKIFYLSFLIIFILLINIFSLKKTKKSIFFYAKVLFLRIKLLLVKIINYLFLQVKKIIIFFSQKTRIINLILFIFLNYWFVYYANFASDRMSILYLLVFIILIAGYSLEDRIAFGLALIYLILTPFQLSFGDEIIAENLAILAYFSLVIGTIRALFTLNSKKLNSFKKMPTLIKNDYKNIISRCKNFTKKHPLSAKFVIFIFEEIFYLFLIFFFSWVFILNISKQYNFSLDYFGSGANLKFIQIFVFFYFIVSLFFFLLFKKIKKIDYKSKILIIFILFVLFSNNYGDYVEEKYSNRPLINEITYLRGDVWWEVTLLGKNFGQAVYENSFLKLNNKDVRVLSWNDKEIVISINSQIDQSGFVEVSNNHGKTIKKYLKIKNDD